MLPVDVSDDDKDRCLVVEIDSPPATKSTFSNEMLEKLNFGLQRQGALVAVWAQQCQKLQHVIEEQRRYLQLASHDCRGSSSLEEADAVAEEESPTYSGSQSSPNRVKGMVPSPNAFISEKSWKGMVPSPSVPSFISERSWLRPPRLQKLPVTEEDTSENHGVEAGSSKLASRRGSASTLKLSMMTGVDELTAALGWKKPKISRSGEIEKCLRLKFLTRVVKSGPFGAFMTLVILLNAAFMYLDTDFAIKASWKQYDRMVAGENVSPLQDGWRAHVDLAFCVVFVVELTMRLLSDEANFFYCEDRLWNVVDFGLVVTAVFEQILSTMNMSYLRLLRLLRLVRAVRVVRVVRFCRQLRLMLISVMHALVPVCWAFLFLTMTTYLFGVLIVHGIMEAVEKAAMSDAGAVSTLDNLRQEFASMFMTVISLFTSISNGRDWWDIGEPMLEFSGWYFAIFVFYIVFMVFGVVNTIIGLFVESATEIAQTDRDLMISAELQRKDSYANALRKLFKDIDTNFTGKISHGQMDACLRDERVQAYFRALELDITEALGLFKLLDNDGEDQVAIDEFVLGCMRLKGQAKNVDLATMMYENKKQMTTWNAFAKKAMTHFQNVEGMISTLTISLPAAGSQFAGEACLSSHDGPAAYVPLAPGPPRTGPDTFV